MLVPPFDESWPQVVMSRRRVLGWVGLSAAATVVAPALAGCAASPDVLVTGGVSTERASAYRDLVSEAIPRVEELWGEDSVALPVHIHLPSTVTGWAAATGYPPDQRGYAASTVRANANANADADADVDVDVDVDAETDTAMVRIVMHPDAWDELSPVGREAVVTHEVAHLAMGPGGKAPWWVEEGLAEYTAHRNSTVALADIAGSALEGAALDPGESWPQPSTEGDAWQGYARAWLACVFIAERHSEAVLPEILNAAAAGQPTTTWMEKILGETSEDMHSAWGTWLRSQ